MTATPAPNNPPNEEPEIVQEESVPSDGKDREGEKLIEGLGQDQPKTPKSAD